MTTTRMSWWRWRITPGKAVLLALFLAAAAVAVYRLFVGLGASTGLNDSMPWGLWKIFDVVVVVPLGATGFVMAFIRYFTPGGERYEYLNRRAVIWAAIMYLSMGARLAFDIGIPWRLPNPLIFGGNLHSPLFEIAWCVALYLIVLFFENISRVAEEQRSELVHKLDHALHKILPGFVLFGILLSTMHHSSLGTLFMILGRRLDPLWYHPWINYVYLLTSIATGLGLMMVIEGWTSSYYKTKFETGLLARLAPWSAGILTFVLAWRLAVLAMDGNLGLLFAARTETLLWWAEILLGYVAPIAILFSKARFTKRGLVTGGLLVTLGMIALRLNVGFTAVMGALGAEYRPTLPEVLFTVGATAGTVVIYTWFVETLPSILGPREQQPAEPLEATGD
ncbi:Ni/Fe-hydrogenase subunit HybB-like protein [Symbiobacterium terraclitae]|uniref:Ni/Fe-hydrogenase subunit HybB-like protein n=1 Tax=Symbiobacterium terraclitae TaxID=557451 RepID=A0ABS4JUS5_9FIRM|nr:hypothetical protein [Symbiobacterium terraclitae]MBP2019312.1 Ni/Fe-hydrogenase subunit HybB-like protein [Symbiobacterium terraclitae]